MGYIKFAPELTEEELMLQTKYKELKNKKEALKALRAPKGPPKPPGPSKRFADARDAREVARKLIKSGAIPAIQKQLAKENQTSFKRPQAQEHNKVVQPNAASYKSFSSTQNTMRNDGETNDIIKSDVPRGNTVFVSGDKVTENYLKKIFAKFGTIVNISIEIEKGRGFVTFSKPESAEQAVNDMHQKNINNIELEVHFAKKQPQIVSINNASSSTGWTTIAAVQSEKGSHKDKREMVKYNDDFFLD